MVVPVRNLALRNGVYETRVQIPKELQATYGKTCDGGSHRTRDLNTALALHAPLESAIKQRIAAIRAGGKQPLGLVAKGAPEVVTAFLPDAAFEAIQAWAKAETDKAYLAHFNGLASPFSQFSDEAMQLDARRLALRERRYVNIERYDSTLVAAVREHGIDIAEGHGSIQHLRLWFADAWASVEQRVSEFRRGDFSNWSQEAPFPLFAAPQTVPERLSGDERVNGSMTISELLEEFLTVMQVGAKDESEMRGYIRRLVEHLGDIPIRDLTTAKLDRFLLKLRKFPITKRPNINRLPFDEIVDQYGDDKSMARLANKTMRTKWFGAINRLCKFAITRDALVKNPVTAAMPRKKDDKAQQRDPWTSTQVGVMFAKPLFTGSSSSGGSRNRPGSVLIRDHKYWLPLIALWSGMRLDEIGTLQKEEFCHDVEQDIWFFDLTRRPFSRTEARRVKNKQSARLVPVHPTLVELGLVQYVAAQDEWLFPELPHGGGDPGATTKDASKWFGRWWGANGLSDDEKFQDFHSFRHSFITELQATKFPVDIREKISGHAGSGNQQTSRGYARSELKLLCECVNALRHPGFPTAKLVEARTALAVSENGA